MAAKASRNKGYVGETRTQLRHGYGIYKYPNQFFRYEGEWKEGKKHGHGKLVMADGSFYEGEFINGEIEGHGFRKWNSSGNTYSGQFCSGELNGYGVMTYGTGSVYEGEFQSNKKEGRGVMKFADGSIYEGLFHNNVRHGEGSQTFDNGDCYIGDWVQDKRQGSGELKFHDGSVYDGQWRNDCYNGAGTLIHCSGVTYDGMWINGRPAVQAAKLTITSDECQELFQDASFAISIEIRSEEDELVMDEQGRELHISAGFRHYIPNHGSPLLDLIEDMEETPQSTPYYDVIHYPLTEYSFMEERLKVLDESGLMKPPSTALSESISQSAAPSVIEEEPTTLIESVANLDLENGDPPLQAELSQDIPEMAKEDASTEQEKTDVPLKVPETEISITEEEGAVEHVDGVDERDMNESPIPPPVASRRTESGRVQFENMILPGDPLRGDTPLPISPPSDTPHPTSAKSTRGKVKGAKTRGTKGTPDDVPNLQPTEQVNFDKIKDPKMAKAKRERMYGDERFARPGEYIIIVSDVTDPPFLGTHLPPAFCRIKVLHPKKLKKVKTPTKNKSTSKTAD